MSFRFCPKCGKKEGIFIKGFCENCFLQDNKLLILPDKLQFEFCRKCNKIKVQRHWVEFDSMELLDFVKSKVKSKDFEVQDIEIELEEIDEKNFNALLEVKGLIENNLLSLRGVIKLQFASGTCDSCMKISSDFFEATIQARFEEKNEKQEKVMNEFKLLISEMNKKDPLSRVVKTIKNRKGFDLVLSSNRSAKISSEKLAKKYNSKVIRSFSVVGVDKSGKEKRRYTYCVRF